MLGIKFPIQDDIIKNTYFSMYKTSKDMYSSNILLILTTKRGSVYFNPEFGSNYIKYMFEVNDGITQEMIKNDILKSINRWLPNLIVDRISIDDTIESVDDENKYLLRIDYSFLGLGNNKGFIEIKR